MQRRNGQLLFSASDVVDFLECEHLTTLSLTNVDTPLQRAEDDEQAKLIQDKGYAHESAFLDQLRSRGLQIVEIEDEGTPEALANTTRDAMRAGADYIFQAVFLSGKLFGKADFLRRVPQPSHLGDYSYEVIDTKLARSPKAKFIVQLCFYGDLLAEVQGVEPRMMHLILGDGSECSFRVANYSRYFHQVRDRFLAYAGAHPNSSYPERCDHCELCLWRDLCAEQWRRDDHLNQVAGITRNQIERLHAAGVKTLEGLARMEPAMIPKLQLQTVVKLHSQAALQLTKRSTGESKVELLPPDEERRRGFFRLPSPDPGDVFFDMEGDPFEPDGLDYLFGVRFVENEKRCFRAFWGHNREGERQAFGQFMDFIGERMRRHPAMHIYHYAHYEPTALKRLMSLHGTREVQVDDLLRQGTLVDLYKVVREAIRTSEPGLSLKDIESLYGFHRQNDVATAGASIVYYERWRSTSDADFLKKIESYNADDCHSTQLMRDWLLSLRPAGLPWFLPGSEGEATGASEKVQEFEARLAEYERRLLGGLPPERLSWTIDDHVHELVHQLLGFYRRQAKAAWWAMFARQDMSEEELADDLECLGGLRIDPNEPPVPVKRSFLYTFSFPPQETKLKAGDDCHRTDTTELLGEIVTLDEATGKAQIKVSAKRQVPAALSVGPGGPIGTDILCEAVFRFADSLVAKDGRFPALRALLRKDPPSVHGHAVGAALLSGGGTLLQGTLEVVRKMDNTHLFIQGPPGAGKTYAGSHLVVELLRTGARIGVTSNSHKAINNLLNAIETCAKAQDVSFRGAKKVSGEDSQFYGTLIVNVTKNEDAINGGYQLIAGTAWLFADPDVEESIDYLFIDEAGQVALANLVAMGTSARNIVLLGDQMQLGQPIQGVHPGRSGESTLEYLLDGAATIAAGRGIFLPTSRRMHEDVCRFISDAVYDGRLEPEPINQTRHVVLSPGCHPALRAAGIRFLRIVHDGRSQRSPEEAEAVKQVYESLLEQSYVDQKSTKQPMTVDNIVVVAPYNAQVNLLKSKLSASARVGTIDKFQGQEAEAVIISMTTSSGEYLPRNIEFLYNKNRLNVAVSRAKCLVVLIASPALLHIRCTTPERMELVNTLCWLEEYSRDPT